MGNDGCGWGIFLLIVAFVLGFGVGVSEHPDSCSSSAWPRTPIIDIGHSTGNGHPFVKFELGK
jgi:hypothetical protein